MPALGVDVVPPTGHELTIGAFATTKRIARCEEIRPLTYVVVGKKSHWLKKTDLIAYLRFASVYLKFDDLSAFEKALKELKKKQAAAKKQ